MQWFFRVIMLPVDIIFLAWLLVRFALSKLLLPGVDLVLSLRVVFGNFFTPSTPPMDLFLVVLRRLEPATLLPFLL